MAAAPVPVENRCYARCTYIHDSFTPGCGVTRARARCANAATLQLADPETGLPIDTQNPHLQAQIDTLDLAVRPRQGPIPVCPHHAGLVARSQAWSAAGKAAGVGAAATVAAGLAYGAKALYNTTEPTGPEQKIKALLRKTLHERRVKRLESIKTKLEAGLNPSPADRALLARAGLLEKKKPASKEAREEALLRRIREQDDEHAISEYTAAYRAWRALPPRRRAACLRGCPDAITPEQRRLLRSPPPAVTARVPAAAASAGWAWEGEDVPPTLAERFTSLWEDAKTWLGTLSTGALDAAARVARGVADRIYDSEDRCDVYKDAKQCTASQQCTWRDNACVSYNRNQVFHTDSMNDPRNELNLAMAQRDRYVYSISSMALAEALTAAEQRAQAGRQEGWLESARKAPARLNWFRQTRYYRNTPYSRGLLATLKESESPTGKASFDQAKLFQDRVRRMGLMRENKKVANWTPRDVGWGWLFDMQSNTQTHKIQWTASMQEGVSQAWDNTLDAMREWWEPSKTEIDPAKRRVNPWQSVRRVDAAWADTVDALFRVPEGEAESRAYVNRLRADLGRLRAQLQEEMDHSWRETTATAEDIKGLAGIQDAADGIPYEKYRNLMIKTYRNDQRARYKWLQAMHQQVSALLKDDTWLGRRQTRTSGVDASWQARTGYTLTDDMTLKDTRPSPYQR